MIEKITKEQVKNSTLRSNIKELRIDDNILVDITLDTVSNFNKMLPTLDIIINVSKKLGKNKILVLDWGHTDVLRILESLRASHQIFNNERIVFIIPPIKWEQIQSDNTITKEVGDEEIKVVNYGKRLYGLKGMNFIDNFRDIKLEIMQLNYKGIQLGFLNKYVVFMESINPKGLNENSKLNTKINKGIEKEIIEKYNSITKVFQSPETKFKGIKQLIIKNEIEKELRITVELDKEIGIYKSKTDEFIKDKNKRIKEIELKEQKLKEENNQEEEKYQQLIDEGLYSEFFVTENIYKEKGIVGITAPINIKHNNKVYYIGEFLIKMRLDNMGITMMNLSNGFEGYDHPHISGNNPCFGNMVVAINDLKEKHEFPDLFCLLYDYLCSYNPAGPYCHLERGWGEEWEWCKNCGRVTKECVCNKVKCRFVENQ